MSVILPTRQSDFDSGREPHQRGSASAFRLLWLGAIALPIIAFALGGLTAWNSVVRFESEAMLRSLDIVNEQTMRTLETQEAVLAAMDAFIHGMAWDAIATDAAVKRLVDRVTEATPTVFGVNIIAPGGRLVIRSGRYDPDGQLNTGHGYALAFPPGVADGRAYISDVEATPEGLLHVHVARPRHGPDGRPDGGILSTAFAPSHFERIFRGVAETPGTGIILAREDGSVLARYPVQVAAAGERLAADDPVLSAGRDVQAGSAGRVIRTGSLFGGLRMLAVRRTRNYPLLIAYGVDPAVVRQAWLRQIAPVAIGAAAMMALLVLLTARVQRRLDVEWASLFRRTATAERGRQVAHTRAELESRLRRTEKIAALGQLSAGVAHDFNNLLQSIVISAESLTEPNLPPADVREIGALILRVGERGKALTRRMLDYARRDEPTADDTDVAGSLGELEELLSRSLGPRYRLRLDLAAAAGLWASCPSAEFETVIINLVANARDAMPNGGDITIAVSGAEAMPLPSETGLRPGRYLQVAVTDSGHGMDQMTLARAGEAFFTTKPRGQGTGLGLSMARGFADRSGGKLGLASVPGRGTTVTLWLPAA